ncbi:MAG: NUDIX hydrolase [Bacteroidota bacterium]
MKHWKKLKESFVYQGYRNILRKTFALPHGKEVDFDIIDVPSFVCIAALTDKNQVLLVDQYRPGPEICMLSFPEGRIDPGEEAEVAVQRELREETGYQAQEIKFLKSIPHAYSNQSKIIYLALGCQLVSEQELDEHEFIDVLLMDIPQFKHLLLDPQHRACNSIDAGYLLLHYLEKGNSL